MSSLESWKFFLNSGVESSLFLLAEYWFSFLWFINSKEFNSCSYIYYDWAEGLCGSNKQISAMNTSFGPGCRDGVP